MSKQLREFFEEVKVNNEILYKPDWYEPETEIYLSYKEIYILAKLIHETLYEEHPKLKALVNYFSEIASVFTKLNLPIIWSSPAGLLIKQKYVQFKTHKIKSSLFYKSSSYSITLPTTKISLKHQKAGLLPNTVHSLDASNIYLLIDKILKDKILKDKLDLNLFSVHDCFATTGESMGVLNRLVRSSFIELYSDNKYLTRLDNLYRFYIKESGYNIEDNKIVLENQEPIEIPQPPISENLNLHEMVDKAIYLIH